MYNYNNFQKNQKTAKLDVAKNNNDALKSLALRRKDIAGQIMQIARENNVPVLHDADLTEIFSILEMAEHLPFEVYSTLAQVITCLYEQEAKITKKR